MRDPRTGDDASLAKSTSTSVPCPLCQRAMTTLFRARDYRRPTEPDRYDVVWCDTCSYGMLGRALSRAEVASFYDVDYYTHTTSGDTAPRATFLERLRAHLAWRLDRGSDFSPAELGPGGRVIDIGCGAGDNLRRLRAAGFDVVGVEPDPAARRNAARFAVVHDGTAESIPESVGTGFDYALLSHVLEHTISPLDALREARRLLTDSGRLVVEVPNCEALGFETFGPHWPWTDVPRHIHFFTLSSLSALLERAGFRVARVSFTGFTRQFRPEWIRDLRAIQERVAVDGYRRSGFEIESWGLLLESLAAPDRRKYDSLRVHALPWRDAHEPVSSEPPRS